MSTSDADSGGGAPKKGGEREYVRLWWMQIVNLFMHVTPHSVIVSTFCTRWGSRRSPDPLTIQGAPSNINAWIRSYTYCNDVAYYVTHNQHNFVMSTEICGILTLNITKHPWIKGIQVCSDEGPRPFPGRDNYEIAKIHWWNLKIFFSRTTRPN